MFGFGNKKQLEELIHSYELLSKMYSAVEDKLNNLVYDNEKAEEQLTRVKNEIKELKDEIKDLIDQYDSKLVEEVKLYLSPNIDKLLKEQNNLYATVELHVKNSFIQLEARFGDLDSRIDAICKEIQSYGIDVVKEVLPKIIKERMEEEIHKVLKAYLEINLYAKSKDDLELKLEKQGIKLSDKEKEELLIEIKRSVNLAVEAIMGKVIAEEIERKTKIIKSFDREKELVHEKFDKLLTCVEAGIIPMLVGPAGTGKSTAVEQVARALRLPFYTMNRIQNSFDLTGYNDANGKYVSTQFYDAYVNGGIFFFDEIDASSPEALVTINTALAQGYMAFPNGLVKMHPDFKVVAAGNTYGKGANRQYCGRNSLDSATLDRFMIIEWDYDRKLEEKLIPDKELLEFAWAVRDVIEQNRMQIIISTRGIKATAKIIAASTGKEGFSLEEALEGNLFENVSVDTLNTIVEELSMMQKFNGNKYFKALGDLKVRLAKNKR